jgi:hypothetical protein
MNTPAQTEVLTEAPLMTPLPAGRYPRLEQMLDALARRMSAQTPLSKQEIRRALGLIPPDMDPPAGPPVAPQIGKGRSRVGNGTAQSSAAF